MQYYEKNMEVLKNRFNSVYKKIKDAEQDNLFEINKSSAGIVTEIIDKENEFTIYIEEARKNGYTMKVKKDNKGIYFHSKYAPEREAEKIVKEFGFSSKKQIFILGIGLGYYLNQFNNENKFDKIIVAEPFLSIFYAALCFNDLSDFFNQKNIAIILEENNKLFDIIRMNIIINLKKDIDFLELSPALNIFNDSFKEIYKQIREAISFQQTNLVSNIKQTKKWRNNMIHNLPYIINNPKADNFFGEFNNIPAICVSAGPSLDKNIKELKKAKEKSIIMCVGTALKALLKHNIEPDIVVSMDGNIANFRHFEDIKIPDSYLLTELGNQHLINEKWNEKQIFFTMKRNFSGWIEKIKGGYTVIQTGGTVAHSMIDLAYKFGADPIVLVGQDLAYENNKTHASGTTYENDKAKGKDLFEVEGINGDKVMTSKSFQTMLSFFNNYFSKRDDRLFIDATEGGAKIENTKIMKLEEVINMNCNKETKVRNKLDKYFSNIKSKIDYDKELKIQIKDTISELKDSIEITKKQIKAMDNAKKELSKESELSIQEINDLEHSFSKYEKKLKSTEYLSFFVEKILIAESMKLDKVKSKYYFSEKKSLEERLNAYYDFRKKFLEELEQSLNLMETLYLTDNDESILNKETNINEREELA